MGINAQLLPVKAHYLFFMATMGPILPFLPVFGKQLGVSEVVMGLILSIIPIMFMIAKPVFGFILDYYRSQRKAIFIALVLSTTVSLSFLLLIPQYEGEAFQQKILCSSISICPNTSVLGERRAGCHLVISNHTVSIQVQHPSGQEPLYCSEAPLNCSSYIAELHCVSHSQGFYSSPTFWVFFILISLACVGYAVANNVSDIICFDVLGDGNEKKYGQQRVWGTVGYGLSALLGGFCVDCWSGSSTVKDYTPALLIAMAFTSMDMLCCAKLKLPELPKSSNIMKDVTNLVRNPSIATFLVFAVFLGICDSFTFFYLFWYLEDLAMASGTMGNIKLLQGLTVAAETLIGEVIFFPLSGKILSAVGYRHCLSLCFLVYSSRLGLLSLIVNPWWVLVIELLQGPSYALGYTTMVAYASAISPPGTSATVQGIAAGMNDGIGYSLGSLAGGFLYKALGGSKSSLVFSGFALVCSLAHWLLYLMFFRDISPTPIMSQNQEKQSSYNSPQEASELVVAAS